MKKTLLLILSLLPFLFFVVFLIGKEQKAEIHLAIIPHFMLASEKVDEFYAFLKSKRYSDHDPDTVIIISPNHFNPRSITPQTICESREVYFKQQSFFLTPFPNISCEENIFYPFGSTIITNEHGIGEQLPRIAKYFSEVKQIIPLILPSHREPTMSSLRGEAETSVPFIRSDDTLIIASVDFSHYLPEAIAQSNDKTSITVLQSGTGKRTDFSALDVDCPSCLYFLDHIAKKGDTPSQAQLYDRDSSSTILKREMGKENTSRVFMWYAASPLFSPL